MSKSGIPTLKMGKLTSIFIAVIFACCLASCCEGQQQRDAADPTLPRREILIVYLSRTNNTKAVAEFIHESVGGTLIPLELETPYPENYQAIVRQVVRENETGYLPPLKTKISDIEKYDVIFLGFPTWGMQLPPPMKSFLRQHSLRGKTVIPFNTNAGYGEGSSFQTVRELCAECNIREGFVTHGGIERDGVVLAIKEERARAVRDEVSVWLRKLSILQMRR